MMKTSVKEEVKRGEKENEKKGIESLRESDGRD